MIPSKLRNGIIVVVTLVWTANFAAGFFMPSYENDQGINAIFMGIVGGLFALGAKNDRGNKNGADDSDSSNDSKNNSGGAAT